MSVKIRLTKTGKVHQVSFRIAAQETRSKRDGKFLEIVGFYNPKAKGTEKFKIKKDRLQYWISKGALPSPAVEKLIKEYGRAA